MQIPNCEYFVFNRVHNQCKMFNSTKTICKKIRGPSLPSLEKCLYQPAPMDTTTSTITGSSITSAKITTTSNIITTVVLNKSTNTTNKIDLVNEMSSLNR